ncbi:hypothetical protein HMPREF3226_00173 [Prevotella corporis]|uniref:Uncharacterized protein n=1 Tax=Prevotella corporis TaxID=28128 RepID=A0A133QMZ6_9BACT|nr:hypothetical protein HMPREF3226_00173 [Prevotella corporis]
MFFFIQNYHFSKGLSTYGVKKVSVSKSSHLQIYKHLVRKRT